jgi:hypothetical protein
MLIQSGADLRREAFLMACFGRYLQFALDDSLRDDRGGRFDPFEPGITEADWAKLRGSDAAGVLRINAFESLGVADHSGFREHFDRFAASLAQRGATLTLNDVLA